ncbi:MAG: 2-phosphosulfolactate phosphatase [Ignavibacteria bacterium]|nr:2-phosphosulfolactate phosphatase [Ignavibacteria bacterium]
MPKINLYITHSLIADDLILKDKNVIIIDVLRTCTSITVSLFNKAKEVIPAESVAKAAKLKRSSGETLLCGEKNGKIIQGFNLGNSPLEFTENNVKGKILVFCTTNGTISIVKARLAKNCIIGSFVNLAKVVEYITGLNEDIVILCSGKQGNFSLEDFICAGAIIREILKSTNNNTYELNDPENSALTLSECLIYDNNSINQDKVLRLLQSTEHGKYLMSLTFIDDIKICAGINTYPVLPVFHKDVIKLKEQFEYETSQRQQMKKIDLSGKPKETKT